MERTRELRLFEDENIVKAAFKLAIPSVIGQMILVMYNMADTFFIGMSGDDAKMTAITISMPAFMILSAISNLFGIGGASAISRSLGSGEKERTRSISSYSFWACLLVTAIYSISVAIFAGPLVNMLGGTDPRVHGYAIEYLYISVFLGGPVTAMSALLSHLIRAEGRSMEASLGIMLGGILNIILDPIFMFSILPRGNEVKGAAIATAAANGISFLYFLCIMLKARKNTNLSFRPELLKYSRYVKHDVLRSGLPACMMTLCENVSYGVLDKLISSYGITVQAGIGVAKKINMMAHSIVRGLSQGILPLLGYSYASGNMKRMKKALNCSITLSVLSAVTCMAFSLAIPETLTSIFLTSGTEAVGYASAFLRILAIGAPFSAFAYVSISFFQATGNGMSSLKLALMRKGILDIPLMFVLGSRISIYGPVLATPITDAACAIMAIAMVTSFLFHNGKKTTHELTRSFGQKAYTAEKAVI